MRNLLIALVLGATALTFYSALWFKSESIEDDITARVTEDLTSSGAQNIDIGVDGRHVTLTGIVYDEITEDTYLETADATYGALGPIDGLTFQADGGYVNAIKTADGISLRGTVPNADIRAKLVAEAEAATSGAVDDQLIVSGPEAPWQDEAAFGVSQLAGLTSGTLTAAAGAYALSGSTEGDADTLSSGFADREGWKTFISSPIKAQGLSAEVARLNAEVADRDGQLDAATGTIATRDARIGTLESTVAGFRTEVEQLTTERDAIGVELSDLKASLTEGEANTAELRSQLDAATATIGEKDQTIATLQTELENRQSALGSTDERVVALTGELDTANGKIADLTAQVSDRDTTIAALNDQVGRLSTNADQSVADLSDVLAARDGTISDLTAALSDRDQQIASLSGTVAERDTTIASLSTQVEDRDGSLAENVAQIAALSAAAQSKDADVTGLEGQVAALTETVAERDDTIAALQARPVPTSSSAEQCAAQATGALEGSRINFETGSAQISNDSVELLERLTGIALACVSEDLSVDIGGHTDAQGSAEDNQALSEARALSVMAFMTQRGVPSDGLRATGFGESQPVASNDTAEGRAQNRRISFDWQAR